MAKIPYLLEMQTVLAANGTGTLTYTVPNNESLELHAFIISSTGTFNVTGIRVTGGNNITNAGSNLPIPDVHFKKTGNDFNGLHKFIIPLMLLGGGTLYIDVVDTSGAGNTIRTTFNCVRDV